MEFNMENAQSDRHADIVIPGVDTSAGIKQCGSYESYIEFLRDVYRVIDRRCEETEKFLSAGDIKNFTTNVHALKTTCRMLGVIRLSDKFLELEQIGKEGLLEKAVLLAPDVLAHFKELKPLLEPYAVSEQVETVSFSAEAVAALLSEVKDAAADFDINRAEAAMKKLLTYDCGKELSEELIKLSELVNDLDYDEAAALAEDIRARV